MKISKNVIIIGLVLLNIAVVTFFILNRPRGHFPPPQERIVEKLMLDEQQKMKFKELVDEHKSKTKSMHNEIRKTKKAAYKKAIVDQENVDSVLMILGEKLIAVDKQNIKHLRSVKKILKKQQLPAFNELMDNIDRVFRPKPHRKRQGRRKSPPRPERTKNEN